LPPGLCSSPPRLPCADPRFAGVNVLATIAISNYAGILASIRHRINGWGQGLFQANYTYGHALDENSSAGVFNFHTLSLTSPQDPNNLRGSYGSADHDVRHSFNANYVWEVPLKAAFGGRGWSALMNGWQLSGTAFIRTGFPYTVFDFQESETLTTNNYFGLLYAVPAGPIGPDLPCGKDAAFPRATSPCQPLQSGMDARFIESGCATGFDKGNLGTDCIGPPVSLAQGRNRFHGPHYFNTDFTIMKSTKLPGRENTTLKLGFQFFNLFNHPNFGFPDAGLSSPTFGLIGGLEQPPTGILGSQIGGDVAPRMIQLKAELKF
jgi:hypothetical protein